ncbi:MAG: ATP-binding cassette domain-containing protein [Candidatus Bathyarchaeia archaeon]
MTPMLQLQGIVKRFGGVIALRNVDFSINEGEVVGLVGDNGAGKSTLIKIIVGVYQPDEGVILLDGKPIKFSSPVDAWKNKIVAVYQELALAEKLNAVENIFLAHEIVKPFLGIKILDRRKMTQKAKDLLARLGLELKDLHVPVMKLSGGERQAVALSRALNLDARLICMDEPTAALAVGESEKVLSFVHKLKNKGKAVIFISHNIEHVFKVVDRIVVLRHGQIVADVAVELVDRDTVVKLITGTLERWPLERGQKEVMVSETYK